MKRLRSKLFSMTMLVGIVALVVAACGGGDPTATPRPTAVPPAATPVPAQPTATPVPVPPTAAPEPVLGGVPDFPNAKFGGTLIRAKPSEGPGWDGHRERTENTHDIIDPAYDQIVMVDPHDQTAGMVNQLADSWEITGDGLTYIFKIHPGVKFHNGNSLTASDFVFTYEDVIMDPPEGIASRQQGLFSSAKSVHAPDDTTVVVRLSQADAAFLAIIGFGRIHIFDEQFIEAEGRERMQAWPPMGTGPFMGEEGAWTKGVSVEIVRNPNYFVEGRPFLDGMKFFFIPDKGTRIAAFLTGQLNFGVRPNKDETAELKSKLGNDVYIQETSTLTWWDFNMDTKNPPFSDVRVREAVAWALDKQGMILGVRQGYGILGGTIAPGTGWNLPESELLKYAGYSVVSREDSIAKAKALLTEAGFPNGLEADVWTRQHPSYITPATIARAMLDEVGITGGLVFAEQAVYFENQRNLDVWDIQAAGHRFNGTDPNFMIKEYWLEDAARNVSQWSSAEVDSLFEQQNRESDPAKRQLMVTQIERLTLESYANPIQFFSVGQYAWYSFVKNYFTHTAYKANQQFRDVWIDEG